MLEGGGFHGMVLRDSDTARKIVNGFESDLMFTQKYKTYPQVYGKYKVF